MLIQELSPFLVEIISPPGLLLCGSGFGLKSSDVNGWVLCGSPEDMVWELHDLSFLEMPVWGNA